MNHEYIRATNPRIVRVFSARARRENTEFFSHETDVYLYTLVIALHPRLVVIIYRRRFYPIPSRYSTERCHIPYLTHALQYNSYLYRFERAHVARRTQYIVYGSGMATFFQV